MAQAVYILGAVTTLCCAVVLLRAYFRTGTKLLLWSGLCFAGLTISNLLVFVDLILLPSVDLYLLRLSIAAVAMLMLLYGLVWEGE